MWILARPAHSCGPCRLCYVDFAELEARLYNVSTGAGVHLSCGSQMARAIPEPQAPISISSTPPSQG